jgi:peptide/nickel transport system substrate-binding protein
MRIALPLALLLLAGCGSKGDVPDHGPIMVSVIGKLPRLVDPSRRPLGAPDAVLLGAVAQGLVRFDAAAQIESGLAIRWDVSDDGLYYTFRLSPDAPLDAEAVARRLRAAANPAGGNPLASELTAIAQIVAVTDEVVEIRLSAPRPDLLQLLAQPELALVAKEAGGPFRKTWQAAGQVRLTLLRPPVDPAEGDAPAEGSDPGADIVLRGERAALAVARFKAGQAGIVLGGRFADLAVARTDGGAGTTLHIDPATGLFGFLVADNRGLLSAPETRRALALALDRDKIVRLFADNWPARAAIVPTGTDDLSNPATPDWAGAPIASRIAAAAAAIADWRRRNPTVAPAPLRVAMPAGPGARLLFALVAQDWRRIGLDSVAVAADAPADLRLVDQVAPTSGAAWYLHRFACGRSPVCSEAADTALAAARTTRDPVSRAVLLADADQRLMGLWPFLSIAAPLRWSLVAPNLGGYRDNPRAIHPLDQLRNPE